MLSFNCLIVYVNNQAVVGSKNIVEPLSRSTCAKQN
jgi:hypothetical protein